MRKIIREIEAEVSSDQLLAYVEGFIQFHRIQASPGHRDAKRYISGKLTERGITNRIISYPADYGVDYLGYRLFQEWSCSDAQLRLTWPEEVRLADFKAYPASVIQKSGPWAEKNQPLDIVLLDKGEDESRYPGLDLKGKVIFLRGDFRPYIDWAVKKRGAVGIISDFSDQGKGTKKWLDLATVSKYRSFWYYDFPEATPFGFSIRPNDGEKLAQMCAKVLADHEADPSKPRYPQAACFVEAAFSPGQIEVVEAEIKGTGDEEVWLTAHSCHPRSCANDNASGVAAVTEAIGAVDRLIKMGRLPPLKRTMKILLMPEFSGTYPYLAESANVDKCVAALNLDMVGGKQSLGYGPLSVVGLPYATPSVAADMCGVVLNELKREADTFGGDRILPMFNALRTPYSGGSDHLILTDPAMGIPCPMLLQWPDIYYHTGGDTLDKICPHLIKKSSTLAAAYAYLMCTFEPGYLPALFRESLSAFVAACQDTTDQYDPACGQPLAQKLGYLHAYYTAAAETVRALIPQGKEAEEEIEKHRSVLDALYGSLCKSYCGGQVPEANGKSDSRIPLRKCRAVVIRMDQLAKTAEQMQALEDFNQLWESKLRAPGTVQYLTQYYMDGKRTVDDVAQRVLFESKGSCLEAVKAYIALLATLDVGSLEAGSR